MPAEMELWAVGDGWVGPALSVIDALHAKASLWSVNSQRLEKLLGKKKAV